MKKLLSILLAAVLLCSLCGVSALADGAADICGSYTLIDLLDSSSDEDMSEAIVAMAAMGMTATLVVNEDGSALIDMFGEEQAVTFDFETMTVSDGEDAIPFSFDGETLILGTEEQGFVFSKAGIEMPEGGPRTFTFYQMTEILNENGEDLFPEIRAGYEEGALFALYLFKDGSGSLEMYGFSTPLQFDFDAMTITAGSETVPFTLEGEVLRITDTDNTVKTFIHADPGWVGPYVMTAMINGEDGDMSEQLATLEAVNMLPTLVIDESGKGILNLFDSDMELVFDFEAMTADIQGESVPFTYDKGIIGIGADDQFMSFARVLPEEGAGVSAGAVATAAGVPFAPDGPVTLIVAFKEGSGTDNTTRILAKYAEKYIGQPVVVENVDGGSGSLGWSALAAADPDGMTIGVVNLPNFNYSIVNELGAYKTSDFKAICSHIIETSIVIVRADDSRFPDLTALVAFGREHEGGLTASTNGAKASNHASAQAFANSAGFRFVDHPQAGTGDQLQSLRNGESDFTVVKLGDIVGSEPEFRILGVFSTVRLTQLPDVPTLGELGYYGQWLGSSRIIAAPAGVSDEIIAFYENAFKAAMEDPEYLAAAEQIGIITDFKDAAATAALIEQQQLFAESQGPAFWGE